MPSSVALAKRRAVPSLSVPGNGRKRRGDYTFSMRASKWLPLWIRFTRIGCDDGYHTPCRQPVMWSVALCRGSRTASTLCLHLRRTITAPDCQKAVRIVSIMDVRSSSHAFVAHHSTLSVQSSLERPCSWNWYASLHIVYYGRDTCPYSDNGFRANSLEL